MDYYSKVQIAKRIANKWMMKINDLTCPVLIDGEATPRTLDEYDVDYLHNILEQYPKLERVISSVIEELYLSIDSEIENLMKEEDGETN